MELKFSLHPKQWEIFNSNKQFVVAACGRRFGKTYLAAIKLLTEALKDYNKWDIPLKNKDVWYIAPTFQQGKDIIWGLLKNLAGDLIEKAHENTATLTLINGRRIQIKGSDRPDTLRGVGVSYVVLDEYAYMKPDVWDAIVRPTLIDVKGSALFIGTPSGKNHFYDLWQKALEQEDWDAFTFTSLENPTIPIHDEIVQARKEGTPEQIVRQEYEASFEAHGSGELNINNINFVEEAPFIGDIFITVDPAGFEETSNLKKKRLDETAITIVETHPEGWYIKDVIHGRWDVRKTALKIINACGQYKPRVLGIEQGSLKNALMPYLDDRMRETGIFPKIEPLVHGGKKKTERIIWALQGRLEAGLIYVQKAPWNKALIDQMLDFPNRLTHDDLLDALSYVDQLSKTIYAFDNVVNDYFEPLDQIAGY